MRFRIFFLVLFLAATTAWTESTFYEAYRKGLEYKAAQNWSLARDHFVEAAQLNPQPAKRVRTYGLNFVRDYDPYAHMAQCEVELGLFREAQKHLEISRKAGVMPAMMLDLLQRRIEAGLRGPGTEETERPVQRPPAGQPPPKPAPAVLKAETNPPGASLWLNGTESGKTPVQLNLPPGDYQVEFRLEGFQAVRDEVKLQSGETQTLRTTLAPVPEEKAPTPAKTEEKKPQEPPVVTKPEATTTASEKEPVVAKEPQAPPQEKKVEEKKEEPAPPPVQQAEPAPRKPRLGSLLLLLVLVALFLLWRRRGHKAEPVPKTSDTAKSSPGMSDTPTQALGMETVAQNTAKATTPMRTPTPLDSQQMRDIAAYAMKLPEGVRRDFGAYSLEAILGRGGMGTTYLAARKRDNLPVALKVPHEHLVDNPEFIQRFLREGSLGSTLHHPNIIRVFEAGKAGDRAFIAMELLSGVTLEKKLRQDGALPIREALEVVREIALALDYARLKGIVHRDLKPDNIFLPEKGGVKVMDYGIARIMDSPGLTSSEAYLGTPSYSSPEAIAASDVDQRSDLYSLGIILFRMLSGELPFQSKNPLEVLEMHRSKPLPEFSPSLRIPDNVAQLVRRLSAKKREDRYPDAEAFLTDLNAVLNQQDN